MNRVVPAEGYGCIAKTATKKLELPSCPPPTESPNKPVKKRARQKCKNCGAFFGKREGEHPKFKCPAETEEQKEAKNKSKRKIEKDREDFKAEMQVRAKTAEQNIESGKMNHLIKHPDCRFKREYRDPTGRECQVCFRYYNKNWTTDHPLWHWYKDRRLLYCPFADDEGIKNNLVAQRFAMQEERSKKRAKTN
jgi:hypothetical protein